MSSQITSALNAVDSPSEQSWGDTLARIRKAPLPTEPLSWPVLSASEAFQEGIEAAKLKKMPDRYSLIADSLAHAFIVIGEEESAEMFRPTTDNDHKNYNAYSKALSDALDSVLNRWEYGSEWYGGCTTFQTSWAYNRARVALLALCPSCEDGIKAEGDYLCETCRYG